MNDHPHVDSTTLCIVGSRVAVRRLWWWYAHGTTVETLIKRYPDLGPAKVLDALAFAYDNLAVIEDDIARAHHDEPIKSAHPKQDKFPF